MLSVVCLGCQVPVPAPKTAIANTTFSAVHTTYAGGATNCRAMVYMNATKSGDEYIDVSSVLSANGRVEILVLDGSTNEHLTPFLVDKDGRTYVFGSSDGSTIAGSAYYERVLDIKTTSNNKTSSLSNTWSMNNNTQYSLSWHGFPVNMAAHSATRQEFVYYHLNINTKNYRSGYTEWASGLGISPSGDSFDFKISR